MGDQGETEGQAEGSPSRPHTHPAHTSRCAPHLLHKALHPGPHVALAHAAAPQVRRVGIHAEPQGRQHRAHHLAAAMHMHTRTQAGRQGIRQGGDAGRGSHSVVLTTAAEKERSGWGLPVYPRTQHATPLRRLTAASRQSPPCPAALGAAGRTSRGWGRRRPACTNNGSRIGRSSSDYRGSRQAGSWQDRDVPENKQTTVWFADIPSQAFRSLTAPACLGGRRPAWRPTDRAPPTPRPPGGPACPGHRG